MEMPTLWTRMPSLPFFERICSRLTEVFVIGNNELNRVDRGLHPQGSKLGDCSETVYGVSQA